MKRLGKKLKSTNKTVKAFTTCECASSCVYCYCDCLIYDYSTGAVIGFSDTKHYAQGTALANSYLNAAAGIYTNHPT
jgi:putative bacteriocin precursor